MSSKDTTPEGVLNEEQFHDERDTSPLPNQTLETKEEHLYRGPIPSPEPECLDERDDIEKIEEPNKDEQKEKRYPEISSLRHFLSQLSHLKLTTLKMELFKLESLSS